MANTLTNIMPKILARGLLVLREQAIMPRLVNLDYGQEAAQKGQTIDVPTPPTLTAQAVTPAPVYSSAQDASPGLVQINLNNWQHVNFYLTDKEMVEVDENRHFIPFGVQEAVHRLAQAVDLDIHEEYVGIYGFVGTAGTTPFASDVADAVNARKVLNQQLAPADMNRRIVLDPDAEANALLRSEFADISQSADRPVKIEGELGRKYGFDFFMSQNVRTHTAGTAGTDITVASTTAAGATTVGLTASATGTLVAGDIITFANDTQTYVVNTTANVTTDTAVSITPALATQKTAGTVVTKKASHTVNLAFHRNAFAFANRPLRSDMELGSRILAATDPMTGISLRLEVARHFKETSWDYDILWGAKLVRPELGVRIAG